MQSQFLADEVYGLGGKEALVGMRTEAQEVGTVQAHPVVEGTHADAGGHGNLAL